MGLSGFILFAVGGVGVPATGAHRHDSKMRFWIRGRGFGGQVLIGWLGPLMDPRVAFHRKSPAELGGISGVVIVFALVIFYWAVRLTLTKEGTAAAVCEGRAADQLCANDRRRNDRRWPLPPSAH